MRSLHTSTIVGQSLACSPLQSGLRQLAPTVEATLGVNPLATHASDCHILERMASSSVAGDGAGQGRSSSGVGSDAAGSSAALCDRATHRYSGTGDSSGNTSGAVRQCSSTGGDGHDCSCAGKPPLQIVDQDSAVSGAARCAGSTNDHAQQLASATPVALTPRIGYSSSAASEAGAASAPASAHQRHGGCAAGQAADTPDRALLHLQHDGTPMRSPDISLATCGFATSTADVGSLRPSPMLHSPQPSNVAALCPASGVLPVPSPDEHQQAPSPLMPAASAMIQPGQLLRLQERSTAPVPHAAARQSHALVQFCNTDDPLLRGCARSMPAHGTRTAGLSSSRLQGAGSAPAAHAHDRVPSLAHARPRSASTRSASDAARAGSPECWPQTAESPPAAATPTRTITLHPAGQSRIDDTIADVTPLSAHGSYCSNYAETWQDAMAVYATAKRSRRAQPSKRSAPSHSIPKSGKLRSGALHVAVPPDIYLATPSPAGPAAVEPSPAGSAMGHARALPSPFPTTPVTGKPGGSACSHAVASGRHHCHGTAALHASPSPIAGRLSAFWGTPTRTEVQSHAPSARHHVPDESKPASTHEARTGASPHGSTGSTRAKQGRAKRWLTKGMSKLRGKAGVKH